MLQELKGKVRVTGIFPAKANSGECSSEVRQSLTMLMRCLLSRSFILHAYAASGAALQLWEQLWDMQLRCMLCCCLCCGRRDDGRTRACGADDPFAGCG